MGFVVLFYSLRHSESLGLTLGSLSSNVFERRTSTGSGLFSFFDGGFAQIFSQIASITVKKRRNTNLISSRHVKRENTSLPVDVRRSKTSLLKLPILAPRTETYFRSSLLSTRKVFEWRDATTGNTFAVTGYSLSQGVQPKEDKNVSF